MAFGPAVKSLGRRHRYYRTCRPELVWNSGSRTLITALRSFGFFLPAMYPGRLYMFGTCYDEIIVHEGCITREGKGDGYINGYSLETEPVPRAQ